VVIPNNTAAPAISNADAQIARDQTGMMNQ